MFNTHIRNSLLAVMVAGTLSACGGGSDYRSSAAPQANPTPQIQGLTDQSFAQDTTVGPLPFSVSDDAGADGVIVTASSSDTSIIPSDNIIIGGSGASRTLQITPAADAVGAATVTLRAVDRAGYVTTATVRVQVTAVVASFLTTVLTAFPTPEEGDASPVAGRTFTPDADNNDMAFDALLQ